MKLSDFENEEALDLLADIIEPAAEIMSDAKIVKAFRSGKPMLFAVGEILKTHKQSTIEIIAAMHKQTPKELKFNVITLTTDLLEILNDPEIQQVFTLQSQIQASSSSGSATESIGDKEK